MPCGTNEAFKSLTLQRSRGMDQKPYPAEKARGGEIILNTPLRRVIFLSGLIGAVVLVVILMMVR